MNRTETYTGPWPRKRHSHTCVTCKRDRDQGAVACYKSRCALPQQTESCECCRTLQPSATYRPAAPAAAPLPEVQEVAQWYTLISEARRLEIFSALSESQRKDAFKYGLAVSWSLLPQYARDLVTTEWWNGRPLTLRQVSDLAELVEKAIARDNDLEDAIDLPDGLTLDQWGAGLLGRGWAWSDDKCRYEKGEWFVWFYCLPNKPRRAVWNRIKAPIIVDVCIAGNPAENSLCGEPDCVCCPRPAAALEDDGGRTREGNTPTCEDCGESQDHCSCEEDQAFADGAPTAAELESESAERGGVQLDLFGGAR